MAKSNTFLEALGAIAAIATVGSLLVELSAKNCPCCGSKVRVLNNYYCNNCQIYVNR